MRYAIPADVACARVADGAVVLHLGTKRYYSLNEPGAEIWRLLEAGVSVADIPLRLGETFDVAVDVARASVDALLAELDAANLLTMDGA